MKTQHLVEGGTVRIQGYEFQIRNLRIIANPNHGVSNNLPVARFEGHCTENKVNDPIRKTVYNGGTYGGNKLAGYTWDA